MCNSIVWIVLVFLIITPIVVYWLSRIPWGLEYSKWRIVQKGDEYWAEYKNIFGFWVSYWTWENTGYGVPYYDSEDEAKDFIEKMKVKTYAKVVYTSLDD